MLCLKFIGYKFVCGKLPILICCLHVNSLAYASALVDMDYYNQTSLIPCKQQVLDDI